MSTFAMDTGSSRPRMRRLFNAVDDRLLDVAIDHGVFNEDRFLDGIEDMQAVLQKLVEAQPDAVQVSICTHALARVRVRALSLECIHSHT